MNNARFRRNAILALSLASAMLQGCMSTRTYVDPAYATATYADLPRRAKPYQWRIVVEFQRNGQRLPSMDVAAQNTVEQVIRSSGIALPADDKATGRLKVTINNVSNSGSAIAKGFGSGLTFGLIGTQVTDNYEMEAELFVDGKVVRRSGYKHALHTTMGNASFPTNVQPLSVEAAFSKAVEQMMLSFLKDLRIADEIASSARLP